VKRPDHSPGGGEGKGQGAEPNESNRPRPAIDSDRPLAKVITNVPADRVLTYERNGRLPQIDELGEVDQVFTAASGAQLFSGAPFALDLGAHSLRSGCVTEVRPEPILMRAVFANATAKGAM
jgi:hypothetical protein